MPSAAARGVIAAPEGRAAARLARSDPSKKGALSEAKEWPKRTRKEPVADDANTKERELAARAASSTVAWLREREEGGALGESRRR